MEGSSLAVDRNILFTIYRVVISILVALRIRVYNFLIIPLLVRDSHQLFLIINNEDILDTHGKWFLLLEHPLKFDGFYDLFGQVMWIDEDIIFVTAGNRYGGQILLAIDFFLLFVIIKIILNLVTRLLSFVLVSFDEIEFKFFLGHDFLIRLI